MKGDALMSDNNSVFDDLMEGLREVEEYQKGNIKLRTHTVSIPDEEIERSQIFYQNFERLPETSKQKVIQYVDELLQTSNA